MISYTKYNLVNDLGFVKTGVDNYSSIKKYFSTGSIKKNIFVPEGSYDYKSRPSRANREVSEGDVLQARMQNTNKIILVDKDLHGNLFSTGFFQFRPPKELVVPKYLYYFLSSDLFLKRKDELCGGSTQKAINDKNLSTIDIFLPPLKEQQRIVTKLDAAFAEIDEAVLVASNKEKNADKLFKNYLSNIFQTNNQDWKSDNLENITSKIGSGATPRGGQASYKKDGISLIRSMNVHDKYFKYKNLAKIDNEQASKLSNVTVQENDILLNITGASIARCCLVKRDVLPARVNQHVSIIRVKKEIVIPKFIVYGLISKPYKDKLLTIGNSGGATRQAITKTQIEDFIFYYPQNKEEQNNLITKLDSVYLHAQNLGEIYKKQIRQYAQLKSAILKQELQSSEAA